MNAFRLTTNDLIRALRPAVDRAVRGRAENLAREVAEDGGTATVERRGEACVVTVSRRNAAEEDRS